MNLLAKFAKCTMNALMSRNNSLNQSYQNRPHRYPNKTCLVRDPLEANHKRKTLNQSNILKKLLKLKRIMKKKRKCQVVIEMICMLLAKKLRRRIEYLRVIIFIHQAIDQQILLQICCCLLLAQLDLAFKALSIIKQLPMKIILLRDLLIVIPIFRTTSYKETHWLIKRKKNNSSKVLKLLISNGPVKLLSDFSSN